MFGKKKKQEDIHAEVEHVGEQEVPKLNKALSADQQRMIQRSKELASIRLYGVEEIATMPQTALNAELLNVLTAIYDELKTQRMLLEQILERG